MDTHVKRLSNRLVLSRQADPVKIEDDLMNVVPKEDWIDFNYLLVSHGRAVCQARRPRCSDCKISHLCPSAGKV